MSKFNENIEYTDRLRENMREIPFSIYQHLIEEDNILRPRQKVAITDLVESIFAGNRASLMWMPTGGGKTVMLARMLEGFHRDAETQRQKRTLFISDSKEGVRNTAEKIKEFSGVNTTVFYGPEKNLNGEVIVTTYQSWQGNNFPVDPLEFDLVVLDEGHKSLSEARRAELHKYKNALWLPLTATPEFSEAKRLLEYYALGHRTTIPEAVQTSLISSFRNIVLKTGIDINLQEIAVAYDGEFSQSALETEINKKARNYAVAEYLLFGQHPDTGENIRELRGIVGCCSVEHAKDHASVLNEAYKKFFPDSPEDYRFAAHIHGTMPDKQRDKILQDHKAGKIGYLTYADLLIHNYDDPGIQVTVNSRLTLSHVVIQQSHGRGLRIDNNNPEKIALCIDVLDNYVGEHSKTPLVYGVSIGTTSEITDEVKKKAQLKKFRSDRKYVVSKTDVAVLAALVKSLSLKVTVDQEEIFSLIRDVQKSGGYKTDDDLISSDLVKLGIGNADLVTKKLSKLASSAENRQPHESSEYDSALALHVYKVKSSAGGAYTYAINNNPKSIEAFKRHIYGHAYEVPEKGTDDLSSHDFEKLGMSKARVDRALFKLAKSWADHKDAKERGSSDKSNPPPPVPIYRVRVNISDVVYAIKNNPIDISNFKQYALGYTNGLVEKSVSDLSSADLVKLGVSKSTVLKKLSELAAIWKEYEEKKKSGIVSADDPAPSLHVYQVRSVNGGKVYAIKNDAKSIEAFKQYALLDTGSVPDKTDGDLTSGDFLEAGISQSSASRALIKLFKEQKKYEKSNDGGNGKNSVAPPVHAYKVRIANGVIAIAVKNDPVNIKSFKQYILGHTYGLPDKGQDYLTTDDFVRLGIYKAKASMALQKLSADWLRFEEKKEVDGVDHSKGMPPLRVHKVRSTNGSATLAIKNDPETINTFLTFIAEKKHLSTNKEKLVGYKPPALE